MRLIIQKRLTYNAKLCLRVHTCLTLYQLYLQQLAHVVCSYVRVPLVWQVVITPSSVQLSLGFTLLIVRGEDVLAKKDLLQVHV